MEVRYGDGVAGFLLALAEEFFDGEEDDSHVEPEAAAVDVLGVVEDPFLEVGGAAVAGAGDLPEAGDAGLDGESCVAPAGAELVFLEGAGAWADDGHGAFEDVEELGEFVDVGFSEEAADGSDAGVVGHFELRSVDLAGGAEFGFEGFGVSDHGSEFHAAEGSSVAAFAAMDEEDGASVVGFDDESDGEADGEGDGEGGEGEGDVECAFEKVVGGALAGFWAGEIIAGGTTVEGADEGGAGGVFFVAGGGEGEGRGETGDPAGTDVDMVGGDEGIAIDEEWAAEQGIVGDGGVGVGEAKVADGAVVEIGGECAK